MSQQEVFCPHCQGGNAPKANICQWCGALLSVPESPGNTAQYTPPPAPQTTIVAKQRRPLWQWLALGLLGLVLCSLVATAITPTTKKAIPAVQSTNTPAPAIAQVEASATPVVKVVSVSTTTPPTEPPPTVPPIPPTETPVLLTNTPVPPPTETRIPPTVSPKDVLMAALKQSRSGKNITGLDYDGSAVVVAFNISDNLTENMIRDGAKRSILDFLKTLAKSGLPYNKATIKGSFSMVDKFGNASNTEVVTATYTKATVDKINFDNFLSANTYIIADEAVIHPVFRDR